jgi:glycosyltransferase involved in cell wall biosynthesis
MILARPPPGENGPMKIAVLAHHTAPLRPPFAGGVESVTWYLARWLGERGHAVTVFAPPGSSVPGTELRELALDERVSDVAARDVSMPAPAFMAAHHAYLAALLSLACDGEGFDLVHSHSLHYMPVALAPLVPAPVLVTLHCPPTPWLESALRARRGGAPELAAVSRATAAQWRELADVDHVVPNGVDTDAWALGPGGEHAVWCGRMVPEKAPHLAIDAARAAGMPLRLAGPISDGRYWERFVAPRLAGDVRYVGHLGHRDLSALVGRSRVALLTPQWEEPFGMAAAEAMATGTPVAAFARGGLREVVGPAGGRLAPPGDVAALARAIREAAALPRDGVRAFARARHGIGAMGRRYEALYARLLEPRIGVGAPA